MTKEFQKIVKECEKPYDPFNDDKAGERIAEVLANIKIDYNLIQKKLAY